MTTINIRFNYYYFTSTVTELIAMPCAAGSGVLCGSCCCGNAAAPIFKPRGEPIAYTVGRKALPTGSSKSPPGGSYCRSNAPRRGWLVVGSSSLVELGPPLTAKTPLATPTIAYQTNEKEVI
mmetsp:Transcript_37105/g.78323  ORF Transcript_37105/g.78323 Transcript_37105/m.78323 type:complete len:122 (+) Transcript_37105:19-384(+)